MLSSFGGRCCCHHGLSRVSPAVCWCFCTTALTVILVCGPPGMWSVGLQRLSGLGVWTRVMQFRCRVTACCISFGLFFGQPVNLECSLSLSSYSTRSSRGPCFLWTMLQKRDIQLLLQPRLSHPFRLKIRPLNKERQRPRPPLLRRLVRAQQPLRMAPQLLLLAAST